MATHRKNALITGASSGIGEVFARKLAERGYDLIITARRRERLTELATELERKFSGRVIVISADLSKEQDLAVLQREISESNRLDLLINNAGYGIHNAFTDAEIHRWQQMITVHISASVRLCHAAIAVMKKQGGGQIINVSSVAGIVPAAGVVYSGTKSFLNVFSRLLNRELSAENIKIQALCPGFTYTEFHDTREYGDWDRSEVPRFMWMSAEKVVEKSLKSLNSRKVIVIPGFFNKFLAMFSGFFAWISGFILKNKYNT